MFIPTFLTYFHRSHCSQVVLNRTIYVFGYRRQNIVKSQKHTRGVRPGFQQRNLFNRCTGLLNLGGERKIHTSATTCRSLNNNDPTEKEDNRTHGKPCPPHKIQPLRLMEFRELMWPHPLKSLRNLFFTLVIRGYFDPSFSRETFLDGAQQAVASVSALISAGDFKSMDDLISKKAVGEIETNYDLLTAAQRCFIQVDPSDIFMRFIYEIGVIFDDETGRRFVEITTVFHFIRGLNEAKQNNVQELTEPDPEDVYVCNYRFLREYTKGEADNHDWIINKLNHFLPKDVVERSSIFRR